MPKTNRREGRYGTNAVAGPQSKHIASERINADIDAFVRRGGAIEVLGTTQTFKRLEVNPNETRPITPAAPTKR